MRFCEPHCAEWIVFACIMIYELICLVKFFNMKINYEDFLMGMNFCSKL